MTREQVIKAQNIISVLDRIDRVLSTTTIIHNGTTTFEHSFKSNINTTDLCLLAQNYVGEGFLQLLYEKKNELEKKLKQL